METVILIGLQATGKSSFYRAMFQKTHDQISKDLLPKKKKQVRQERLLSEALAAGRSVVIDNTNATRADRAAIIAPAKAAGAAITGYYFESKIDVSLERNETRSGRAKVPKIAILGTAKRLERPKMGEGFDSLFHVTLAGAGRFRISAWIEEAA